MINSKEKANANKNLLKIENFTKHIINKNGNKEIYFNKYDKYQIINRETQDIDQYEYVAGKRILETPEKFIFIDSDKKLEKLKDSLKCNICLDIIKIPTLIKSCSHSFCKNCIIEHKKTSNACPNCRKSFSRRETKFDENLQRLSN